MRMKFFTMRPGASFHKMAVIIVNVALLSAPGKPTDSFGQVILCCESCSVHCGMFSSLYP